MFRDPAAWHAVHHWYGRLVAVAATIMAAGSWPSSQTSVTMLSRAPSDAAA